MQIFYTISKVYYYYYYLVIANIYLVILNSEYKYYP